MSKTQAIGFGFIPQETKHHFLVKVPKNNNGKVVVFERFNWDEADIQTSELDDENIKVVISKEKWDAVKDVIQKEFNRRLGLSNIIVGKFKIGDNPVERLFGKELVLLLWSIEDSDPNLIKIAIKNWLGLSQEERWWLFTMTNATTGYYANKRGWRKAVRYALTENPVDETTLQGSITEYLYKQL